MIEQKETETILHSEDQTVLDRYSLSFMGFHDGHVLVTLTEYLLNETPFDENHFRMSKQDLLELQQIINQMIEKI